MFDPISTASSSSPAPIGPFLSEIWARVAVHLPRTDLGSLSQTCAALRELAQRTLFRTLVFTGVPFGTKVMKKQKAGWLAYTTRLKALASTPRLCALIENIAIVDWASGHPETLVRAPLGQVKRALTGPGRSGRRARLYSISCVAYGTSAPRHARACSSKPTGSML
jgi:hypothetical protein